ncbi:cellulase family glycosylhydrolase [Pedobacter sp. Leaf194]|uniref:cellulase family glycosylhydrolase n=1 Tax=Pedobacter sp. Leaf194 TaxID=1736297 RepID=UPI00070279B8|nr:cellulase family glycosylhydrolase [Pedobacter sp. Leaf194]KQS36366.1 cellulase [Pedobacter sp. Leaf194]
MSIKKYVSAVGILLSLAGCSKKTEEIVAPVIPEPALVHPLIAGVNWADARDNFVDGWVIPSGLEAGDTYAVVAQKSAKIYDGIITNLPGVNAIRLPINPPSVTERWWDAYQATVDQALAKKMKVILCCWESSKAKDGLIDDMDAFWKMWAVVVDKYGLQSEVYIEVINEPYGYSLPQLGTVYEQFLTKFPNLPRSRLLLSGTGYSEDVNGIGADARFKDCLLALHNYAFWNVRSQTDWENNWRSRYGAYASRTVVTEFGAGMTTGKNYTGAVGTDNEVAYMVGSTNVFRNAGLSSVYWPGLRDGDSYGLLNKTGSGTDLKLTVSNTSGATRLRFGWGY